MRESTPGLSSVPRGVLGSGMRTMRLPVFDEDLSQNTADAMPVPANARCNGAPLSETKVKADLASRFSVRSARNFIPEQPETYICHHLPRIKRC